jgi:hypothetical protein
VIQYVAAIRPAHDTVRFTSLGARHLLIYNLSDDHGHPVLDTAANIASGDSAVVAITPTGIESRGPGTTNVTLTIGGASATIVATVRQRVATIAFQRDTIHLVALLDTTTVVPIARDSLGYLIAQPDIQLQVDGQDVVRLADQHVLQALTTGAAILTARDTLTGVSSSAPVIVDQRVTTIDVTPGEIKFEALGDTITLRASPRDRLGSPVPNATLLYSVGDSQVVEIAASHLRSLRSGQTSVTVLDSESGITTRISVNVRQIARSLTAILDSPSELLTIPEGARLPLLCQAVDRNGFAIAREATLRSSAKGTVVGTECSDLRASRSGYDTLVLVMDNAAATRPVIVATAPDSVGIVTAAQPLPDDPTIRYVGENLGNASILALRPLVAEILAAYGNPTSSLGRARAIRDWVARTALYSQAVIHSDNSTSNLSVLPAGKTWADVNSVLSLDEWERDTAYWSDVSGDGYAILNRLLGTLDPITGLRADDGIMVHVAGAHYRMRDIDSYHFLLCSYQTVVLNTLWAAAGLHGMLVWTFAHDPAAVFIPELGRWIYQDPSYNNDYVLDDTGDPVSPVDLLALSTSGTTERLRERRIPGPSYDPEVFVQDWTYMKAIPNGMVFMGSQVFKFDLSNPWSGRFVQIDVPALANHFPANDQTLYPRVTAAEAFPTLGVVVSNVHLEDSVFVVRLGSNYPNHKWFERRLQGGAWEPVEEDDVLPIGACVVEYRSVDDRGTSSATTVLSVWAPREQEFLPSGASLGVRAKARSCG